MSEDRSESNVDKSWIADANKVRLLRQKLGWTQQIAAQRSGYSTRVIQKMESGNGVRPSTLQEVLQCFHEALGLTEWHTDEFVIHHDPDGLITTAEARFQTERIKEWYTSTYMERNMSRVRDFCHEEITFRHGNGSVRQGVDTIEKLINVILTGFNPIQLTFDQCFFFQGWVYTFFTSRKKHVGDFNGIAATNRWVQVQANSRVKFQNGKVIEAEDHWDVFELTRQLSGQNVDFP